MLPICVRSDFLNIINYAKKPKCKIQNYPEIANIIKLFSNNLFSYNTPEGLDKMQVEEALHHGIACLYKCPVKSSVNYGNWCCTPAYPADVVTNNKTFKKCTTYGTDYGLELDVDKDCILLYNNSTKTPDDIIYKYADIIGETDKTINTIIKYSRLIPIPKVTNNSDIAKYKQVMESVLEGNLVNVISDNTKLLTMQTTSNDDMLQLTDTTASDKLHYLSQFRADTIKRLATLYGIPITLSAKNAQVISDELHGEDIYSMYLLYDRYYARKESFARASEFTGFDWDFDFSDLAKHTIADVFSHKDGDSYDEDNKVGDSVSTDN